MKKFLTATAIVALTAVPLVGTASSAEAAVAKKTLSGKAFFDKDGDKKLDRGEAVLKNRRIAIVNRKGAPVAAVRTNAYGNYAVKLAPGTYTLKVSQGRGERALTLKVAMGKVNKVTNLPVQRAIVTAPPAQPAPPKPPVVTQPGTPATPPGNIATIKASYVDQVQSARRKSGLAPLVHLTCGDSYFAGLAKYLDEYQTIPSAKKEAAKDGAIAACASSANGKRLFSYSGQGVMRMILMPSMTAAALEDAPAKDVTHFSLGLYGGTYYIQYFAAL